MTASGFPHSDIPGSKVVCTSPRLIAAYHVLHRLLVPRHPPCALSSLANQDYSKEAQLLLPRRTSVFKELRPGTRPRAAAPPASVLSARRLQGRSPWASVRSVRLPDDWCAIFGHDLQT